MYLITYRNALDVPSKNVKVPLFSSSLFVSGSPLFLELNSFGSGGLFRAKPRTCIVIVDSRERESAVREVVVKNQHSMNFSQFGFREELVPSARQTSIKIELIELPPTYKIPKAKISKAKQNLMLPLSQGLVVFQVDMTVKQTTK